MDITNVGDFTLNNLDKINVVLGKNGCGKSKMLRQVEGSLSHQPQNYGMSKYVTPERGGALIYTSHVDDSISRDANYLAADRRKNQTPNFRYQTISQYQKLELMVLREFEQNQSRSKFEPYVAKINSLLDNIEIRRHDKTFKIFGKSTSREVDASVISSGESELISLGIECLVFSKECVAGKENILFLDEPDVHLHPDLQVRFMRFLKDLVFENNFRIVLATHSTAILGALESYSDIHLAFMTSGQKIIDFKPISDIYRKILPVFGAHPLSDIFNEVPVLLVEGEDDERIWQQAVRSAGGRMKVYPCSVDGVSNLNDFEQETQKIIRTVYDGARGFSLRDRDSGEETIDDLSPIIRMRLSCRNSENLLLSDEALQSLGTTWHQLKERIEAWLAANTEHSHYPVMRGFKESGYDRKNHDIKESAMT